MFSVVIPLYNKAAYIQKAINSVLKQTFVEFELIIVNDGSTDDSVSKINLFTDKRIKIIHQFNSGVSWARNNGVRNSIFDYIAFLDADDWWDEFFLEKIHLLIQDYSEAAIFGTQYFWVKNKIFTPSINNKEKGYRGFIDYNTAYLYAWWMPLSSISVVVRKQAFERLGGFKESLKFGEDLDLWIRFSLEYKIAYLNEPLAYYNQNVEENSRALGADKFWTLKEHVLFNQSFLAEYELKSSNLKQLLDGLRVRSLVTYHLKGWYPQEVQMLLSLVNLSQQPLYYRFVYRWPRPIVSAYFLFKRFGSLAKKYLFLNYNRFRIRQY